MKIALCLNGGLKDERTGLENYTIQLKNTLYKYYSLEGIAQIYGRVPIYNIDENILLYIFRAIQEHSNLVFYIIKNIKLKTIPSLSFDTLELNKKNTNKNIDRIYQGFDKIHYNMFMGYVIKWFNRYKKNKSLLKIPKIEHIDIFWLPYPYPLYMDDTCNVCTIHNVFYDPFGEINLSRKNKKAWILEKIVDTYDILFCISEHTRNTLCSTYPKARKKTFVIYQSITDKTKYIYNKSTEEKCLKDLNIRRKNFILHVGVISHRKNQLRLIDAYLELNLNIPLVLVGKMPKKRNNKLKLKIKQNKNIIYLGHTSDAILNILYKNALLFVFPSINEGFGLPVLEAFYHRCPVITSNRSALPEVAGEAALYVDPYSIKSISEGISKLIHSEKLRRYLIQKGQKQLQKFSKLNIIKNIKSILSHIELPP